ncbi:MULTISPECIES: hypothetical protein [Bacillus]|uniref:hypothetical protein n=1 Tax=Bacillus TaxID=1386 RepID=UPI0001A1523B|nr:MULTISPECIES: hypothetical protein [Bacillus]AIK39598.1 hypothetical protein DJ92_847 [Bacillus pseudomycoides]AJI15389.1 hypothetical protein BG07_4088 [Bacillus pseudomycoides]EEM15766.1 hypothetical protein bpmyx0001_32360 [Bacillus pseudomycoides DSM 12442]MEB3054459.1 hypothetical protein [Bacillus pseudomycoides]MED1597596.1 hypothetical protein [Bacillus pseudomycoides]
MKKLKAVLLLTVTSFGLLSMAEGDTPAPQRPDLVYNIGDTPAPAYNRGDGGSPSNAHGNGGGIVAKEI